MSSNLIPPSFRILLLIDVLLDIEVLVSEGDRKPLVGTLLGIPFKGAKRFEYNHVYCNDIEQQYNMHI